MRYFQVFLITLTEKQRLRYILYKCISNLYADSNESPKSSHNMDFSPCPLPIPLWLEYSRVKYGLPPLPLTRPFFPCHTEPHSLLQDPAASVDYIKPRNHHFSASLSPDKTLILASGNASVGTGNPPNQLKQSIQTLKKSVRNLKRNSQDLYRNIASLGRNAVSAYSSPSHSRANIHSKFLFPSRTEISQKLQLSLSKEEKSTQVDPAHYQTPNETLESMGKLLSFSQLAEGKKAQTPSIPEADISDTESAHSPDNMTFDGSPRSVPASRAEEPKRISSQKRHLTFVKPSSGSTDPKSPFYYLKAVNINGKYFTFDQTGLELTLGRQANLGITLKGKETEGGFRVFATAKDAMSQENPKVTPKKGSRVCLLKVKPAGPSLRCFSGRLSPQEVVFSSVTPQEVIPALAANVLVRKATS